MSVESLLSARTSLRQLDAPDTPIHVVYVVGSGRCGSTLLDRLLGAESGCIAVGELNRIWKTGMVLNSLCSCGNRFRECEYWSKVTTRAFGNWNADDGSRLHALRKQIVRYRKIPAMLRWQREGIPLSGPVAQYAEATVNLYRAIRDISGSNTIIDSSKNCIFPFFLASLPQLKITVVHLIRDSRAVAYSWGKIKARTPGDSPTENSLMPRYSSMHSAWDWDISNGVGASLQWMPKIKYMRIKYEDMVTDLESVYSKVLSHIGASLATSDGIMKEPSHSPCIFSGNPMRFNQGEITIRPDLEWQQQMKWSSKAVVSLLTFPGLIVYRYFPHLRKSSIQE